jgi:RNA polymerase sigma-70 factor (ECF subfamily)
VTDAELVDRCQRGDKLAFQKLVIRYQRRVYSIAYGFVRNGEDAMDLTQDVFLKVHRNLDGFQGSSSFYTWLYRIAVNVSIDHIRRNRRRKDDVDYDDRLGHQEAASSDSPVISTSTGLSPAVALRNKELGDRIMKAMDLVSEAHREILVLREIEGLSYEELAEVLDIPKGTVMSRLHHARNNLKKHLTEYLEG